MAKQVNIQLERWMMPRDREVIISIYKHGMLNSKQIEYIHFRDNKNSKVISLRRLKKMVDAGYLKQHWYGWNKNGTMQHFTLTNKGAMIVALCLDLDPKEVKVFEKGDIRNIEHTVLIGGFHVGLLKSGYEVHEFTSDILNRFEYPYKLEKIVLEPDGKGEIFSPKTGRTYPFLMEMDRGGMNYDRIKNKIGKYENFFLSNAYRREFDSFPIVIIATSTEIRIDRIKTMIEETSKTNINYLLTTIDKMENMQAFHLAKHNKKVAL